MVEKEPKDAVKRHTAHPSASDKESEGVGGKLDPDWSCILVSNPFKVLGDLLHI